MPAVAIDRSTDQHFVLYDMSVLLTWSGRPLTSSEADRALFVDRQDALEAIVRHLRLGSNVAMSGPPGSGRTSTLQQLRHRCPQSVYADGRPNAEAAALLAVIAAAFGQTSTSLGDEVTEEAIANLARALGARHGAESTPTLLLDDPSPDACRTLFGVYRDQLWEVPITWVVSIGDHLLPQLLAPPADAFFAAHVTLQPFDQLTAQELLVRRAVGADDDDRRELLEQVIESLPAQQLQPRELLRRAAEAMAAPDPAAVLRQRADAILRASRLGRTEAMTLAELQTLGAAHAGDERLLGRLGVTRPRLAAVLRRLLSEDLVATRREGRRVLYQPKEK